MSLRLHIAETFHSLKGEGLWSGVPMFFIRFAGCNVGKQGPANMTVRRSDNPELSILGTTCTSWDGRQFGCDTDYNRYETLDLFDNEAVDTFFAPVWEKRVVLTGGEPLQQGAAFAYLMSILHRRGKIAHIETSGTIRYDFSPGSAWVAVAPKLGCLEVMLRQADEIKLLVDAGFDLKMVPPICFEHDLVFVCPINPGREHNYDNLELCQQLIRQNPKWRLGVQLHKFLGIR